MRMEHIQSFFNVYVINMAYENEKGVMTPNRMQHLKGGMQRIDIDIDHCLNLLLTEVVAGNHDPCTRVDTAKLQVELGGIKVELRDIDIRDADHYDDTRQQINEINGHLQEVKTQKASRYWEESSQELRRVSHMRRIPDMPKH